MIQLLDETIVCVPSKGTAYILPFLHASNNYNYNIELTSRVRICWLDFCWGAFQWGQISESEDLFYCTTYANS